MEDNFDKKYFDYKVRCSFIVGSMSPWKKKTKTLLHPKGPSNGLNLPVWV